jgi:hypothetical protein
MQKLGDVLLNLLMLAEQPKSPASGFRRCAGKPPVSLRRLPLFPPLLFGQVVVGRWISIWQWIDFSLLTHLLTGRAHPSARLGAISRAPRRQMGRPGVRCPVLLESGPLFFFSVNLYSFL